MSDSLYVRDGDGFVGTVLTQGGWNPDEANGAAVLAMLGQCLHEVPSLVPMSISRFTADLVRPVPLGRRVHVESEIVRQGKKIQVVELRLRVDGVDHVRATALRLREADLREYDDLPVGTTDANPSAGFPSPDGLVGLRQLSPDGPGFLRGIDLRKIHDDSGAYLGYWLRLDAPVVAGEPINDTARLTVAFDFANLVGITVHAPTVTLINPDVTAHVLRPSNAEWIAVTGVTRFEPALGRGISYATISDHDGFVGTTSVCQLMQHR